ncbi:uncharacterized mitochondrial protein AtMg00810-like [Impatiens glandulifera]|uniref:uncharacterized mitochondrial protein AtMg00810-like n=1 Tax=Impatiens glandulifera TaxID=253017 RepID=UPI001FB08E10|nr:uncharacterized mitochondrial protein AtMg00810-like [Impatiens glandulifera]
MEWNIFLNKRVKSLGFVKYSEEKVVYTRNHGEEVFIVGVYVDDLIVTRSRIKGVEEFKIQMMKEFEMNDFGLLLYYLGIEVKQTTYAKKVLKQFAIEDCNSRKYPMEVKLQLRNDVEGSLVDPKEYMCIIGCVKYLTYTRPGIFYAFGIVIQYMEQPTTQQQQIVKHILCYMKRTKSYGILLKRGREFEELVGFTYSDLAGDTNDRKST